MKINITQLVLNLIRWYNIERVLGLGSLMVAVLVAFPHLYTDSTLELLAQRTHLNATIVSHWFLLSGLFMLWKGSALKVVEFLLVISPLGLISANLFILGAFSDRPVPLIDIVLSFIVISIITQRLIHKMLMEAIAIADEQNLTPGNV